MKPWRAWLFLCCSALSVLAFAAQALAAAATEPNPAEEPIGTLFRWLNFALVFGALGYLIAKYGRAYFRKHAEGVAASIGAATAAKAEAERQLRSAEAKLQGLGQEVAGLRAAAGKESSAEAERIRGLMREEAEKIQHAEQAEIAAAERAARMELKTIAAQLAVERATAVIRQRMNAETQAALFQSFVGSLARSAN